MHLYLNLFTFLFFFNLHLHITLHIHNALICFFFYFYPLCCCCLCVWQQNKFLNLAIHLLLIRIKTSSRLKKATCSHSPCALGPAPPQSLRRNSIAVVSTSYSVTPPTARSRRTVAILSDRVSFHLATVRTERETFRNVSACFSLKLLMGI